MATPITWTKTESLIGIFLIPHVTDVPQGPVLCRPSNNVLTSYKNMSNMSCAEPKNISFRLNKICRTLFVGRHKTGPCVRQPGWKVIIRLRNLAHEAKSSIHSLSNHPTVVHSLIIVDNSPIMGDRVLKNKINCYLCVSKTNEMLENELFY